MQVSNETPDPRLEELRRQADSVRRSTDFSGLRPEQWEPGYRPPTSANPPEPKPPSRVGQLLRRTFSDPIYGGSTVEMGRAAARTPLRAAGGMVEGAGQAVQAAAGLADQVDLGVRGVAEARAARERGLRGQEGPPSTRAPGPVSQAVRGAGEAVEEKGSRIRELFPESRVTAQGDVFQPKNPLWWIERGGEAVTQLGVQLGLAAATGGAAPAVRFMAFAAPTAALEGGNAYRSVKDAALERGASEQEAEAMASGSAALTAAGSTALETLPFSQMVFRRVPGAEKLWGRLFAGSLARRAVGDVAASMTVEGIEEAAQEAWGATIERTLGENPEAFQDITMRMIAAGALGAGAGGLASGVRNVVEGPPTPKGFGTPSEDRVRELIAPEARQARLEEAANAAREAIRRAQEPRGAPPAAPGAPQPPAAPGGAESPAVVSRETPTLRRRAAELIDPSLKPELERLYTDPLTGMGNEAAHTAARERVDADPEREWVRVDLTNFKAINDVMGWAAGDQRIQEVADQVRGIAQRFGIEPRDLFRAKGDEIDIVVPAGRGEELGAAIEKAVRPFQVEGTPYQSAARFGVGNTLEEANQAANAKKGSEVGPRARVVEKDTQVMPEPQKPPAGVRRFTGRYDDGGSYTVDFGTETRTDGSLVLTRTLTRDDGSVSLQYLGDDGTWQRGKAALVSLAGVSGTSVEREGGPMAFQSAEHVDQWIAGEARDSGLEAHSEKPPEAAGVDQQLPPEAVGSSDTYFVEPKSLDLEPDRFQFKDFLTPTGETGALRGVEKWDETRAGVVSAWRDPADGRLKVVNGHQRTNLANKLGAPRLRVMEIQARDAEHAKVMGALINIGEGTGTAVDAAKVMRSQNLDAEGLKAEGIPLSGAIARDGLALSKLDEALFSMVARGRMSVPRGAIIGRSGLTPAQQLALVQLVDQEEQRGKELTNGQVEELAKFVRGAESGTSSQETLFGTETVDMSLAIEKAKLSSWVKGELRKTAAAFREAAKRGRAETLARAGVGTIDQAKARELAGDAEVVLEVYDRLSASAGPVSDVLNRGVRELQEGAKADDVKAAVLSQISAAVEEALAGGAQGGARASAASAPGDDPGQSALFEERGNYQVGRRDPFPLHPGALYSRLERAIEQAPQERMTPEQWLGYLDPSKRGFSSSEEEWVNLRQAILEAERNGKVDKTTLLKNVQARGIYLTETVRGGTDPRAADLAMRQETATLHWQRARVRLFEVMHQAGYKDWQKYPLQNMAPGALELRERIPGLVSEGARSARDNARTQLRLAIEEAGNLGYDTADSAIADLISLPSAADRFNAPERVQALLARYFRAFQTMNQEGTAPPPQAVQEAHETLKEEWHELDRARYALRQLQAGGRDRTSYKNYSAPSGQDYGEITVQFERKEPQAARLAELEEKERTLLNRNAEAQRRGEPVTMAMRSESGDVGIEIHRLQRELERGKFSSSHWPEKDIIVHVRHTTHYLPPHKEGDEGREQEKVLLVNEFQSDLHQTGRKQGYTGREPAEVKAARERLTVATRAIAEVETRRPFGRTPSEVAALDEWDREHAAARTELATANAALGDALGAAGLPVPSAYAVPDTPFKATGEWVELALKRTILEAVEQGHDRVAFLNGKNVGRLMGLTEAVSWLELVPAESSEGSSSPVWILTAELADTQDISQHTVTTEQLPAYVGAAVARQLLAKAPTVAHVQPVESLYLGKEVIRYWVMGEGVDAGDRRLLKDSGGESMTFETLEEATRAAEQFNTYQVRHLSSEDLAEAVEMGGEGEVGFYDDLLPKEVQKYLRSIKGPKLERIEGLLENDTKLEDEPLWSFPITQGIRTLLESQGQRLMDRSFKPGEWQRRLQEEQQRIRDERDLFGEPVEPTGPAQESLLPERKGPQGMTEAQDNARAIVSALEGRVTRGAASAEDERRYREAKALLARAGGLQLPPAPATTPRDDFTGELFDQLKDRTADGIKGQLALAFGSAEKAAEVNVETLKRAGPFADIVLPGVRAVEDRIAAVRKGRAAFVKVDAVGKVVGDGKRIDREAVLRLLQAYRHPAAEFFNVLVVVDGRVVHHRQVTAGSFDTTFIYEADVAEAGAIAARLGGTVIFSHNHPSGNPTPSPEDERATTKLEGILRRLGAKFGGHYITNHLTATVLEQGDSEPLAIATDKGDWNDPRSRRIQGPADVVPYLAKLPVDHTRLDVLLLDNRHRTVAFEARPIRDLENVAEWLPGLRREAAAPAVVLGVGSESAMRYAAVQLRDLPLNVVDIIDAKSGRSAAELGIFQQTEGPVSGTPLHDKGEGGYEVPADRGKAARAGRVQPPALDVAPRLGAADPRSITGLQQQFKQLAGDVAPEPQVAGGIIPDEKLDAPLGSGTTLRPISPVELTRLAFELLGSQKSVFVRRLARWRGAFMPDPVAPWIGLNAMLGKDYEQFAATLAHEIGHAIDFFDDKTMARGNLLGRIASLRRYLQESIADMPSNPALALTPKERAKIRQAAEKATRAALGPKPGDKAKAAPWLLHAANEYRTLIEAEMNLRGLIGLERVTEELILVSEWWRGPIAGTPWYMKYRKSSPELYADALSVLLNSPGSLQERAPTFFNAFLEYFERKPAVKAIYDSIQSDIAGGEDHLMGVRREQLDEDVKRGEQLRKEFEEQEDPQSWSSYLEQLLSSSAAPATRAERRRVKPALAQDARLDVKHALQELNHADNVNRLMLSDIVHQVDQPMRKAELTENDAHEYLLMNRVAYGDRGGMAEEAKEDIMARTGAATWAEAREIFKGWEKSDPPSFDAELLARAETGILNPRGYTPDEAKRNLAALEKKLGPDRWAVLEKSMDAFHDILFRSVREAVRVGSYNQVVYQTKLLPNAKTYATFSVLEYFTGRVPAGVKQQIGTVKAVGSTYSSSILKAMALNRLNELQRAKQAVLGVLDVDFPGTAGPIRPIDRFKREKPPAPGKENLIFLVDGRPFYREVDPYIARMFDRLDIGSLSRMTRALGMRTYQVLHPLYVTLSLAWQIRNVARDWQRTYQNLATAHAGKPSYRQALEAILDFGRVTRSYGGAMGAAWRHARQQHDPQIREMLQDKALGRAFHSFDPIGETTMERLAQRYGLVEQEPAGKVKKAYRKAARVLETVGVFQETLAKAAAWKYLSDQGVTGRERAYIVRNYTGTPDSRLSGLASEATNSLFLYANVTIAGLRADLEVATQPSTAGGWWLRAMLTNFLPKLAMAAALFGWLDGDDDDEETLQPSEWMRHVPSYDAEKYIIVPVPPFVVRNEQGQTKAVYLRFPHMDTDRALGGILWALMAEGRPNKMAHAAGVSMGELPGLNPVIDVANKNRLVLGGSNPIDYFYDRPVIPRTEWEAGGWARYKELIRYDLQQLGIVSQLLGRWVYDSPEESEQAPGEATLRSIPGLSSLVKISDRGLNEERWYEQDYDTQARARLRSGLASSVRRGLSERSNLNRLGVENLEAAEQTRRALLNAWYSQVYIPQTEAMEAYRTAGDDAAFRAAGETIERELAAILQGGG